MMWLCCGCSRLHCASVRRFGVASLVSGVFWESLISSQWQESTNRFTQKDYVYDAVALNDDDRMMGT